MLLYDLVFCLEHNKKDKTWVYGTSTRLINNLTIFYGFFVIECGDLEPADSEDFTLEKYIRHPLSFESPLVNRVKCP